jgi:hypothetical protein
MSARPLAWLVVPLAVLVTALILLFGREDADQNLPPLVTGGGRGLDQVALEGGAGHGDMAYRPITSARRETALQRLAEFRSRYRQVQPFVLVSTATTSEALDNVAQEIGDLLSTHGLGGYRQDVPDFKAGAGSSELPAMRLAPQDARIARELLWALEPLLGGRVSLAYDAELRIDQMQLRIQGHPRFSAEGEAIFDRQ